MREHRAAHAIAGGPDAFDTGPVVLIDFNTAAIIELDTGAVSEQAFGCRASTHRYQQLVDFEGLFALAIGVAEGDAFLADLGLAELGTKADVESLLLEFACGNLGDVGIGCGEEIRQRFEDGDFRAEAFPDAAEFKADHAGTNHAKALWRLAEIECAGVVDDVLAVKLGKRQFDGLRAGGDDHVRRGVIGALALGVLDRDDTVGLQRGETADRGDLVGLEQRSDAAGELLDDLVLASNHRGDIDLRILGADAMGFETVAEVVELLG